MIRIPASSSRGRSDLQDGLALEHVPGMIRIPASSSRGRSDLQDGLALEHVLQKVALVVWLADDLLLKWRNADLVEIHLLQRVGATETGLLVHSCTGAIMLSLRKAHEAGRFLWVVLLV